MAIKNGIPLIGLNDWGRQNQEGVSSLEAMQKFFKEMYWPWCNSTDIAILGPCAGGAVYSPATDFIFMSDRILICL